MAQKILVVEDNAQNTILMRDVLEYHGYTVITAQNGEAGIRLAREELPDLILMDIQMPVMDGLTAIKLLKNNPELQTVRVIAVTSLAMTGDKEKVLQAGCDGYLSKPVDIRQLAAEIKRHLGEGKDDGK